MKISTEDVQKLAHLSRLQLNDTETEAMKEDLTARPGVKQTSV